MMRSMVGVWRFARVLFYILFCIFVVRVKFPKADRATRGRLIRYHSRRILEMAGVTFTFAGDGLSASLVETGLSEGKGVTVISNHVSWLDVFSLDAAIPGCFVAKADIANWPFFGVIARGIGTLFIERGKRSSIVKINRDISEALERGETVSVFAEGTTTCGNELLRLKSNLMAPAASLSSTVLPVVLFYSSDGRPTTRMAFAGNIPLARALWDTVTLRNPCVTVYALEAIETEGMDRREIGELCEKRMREKLHELWGSEFKEFDPEAEKALMAAISRDKN